MAPKNKLSRDMASKQGANVLNMLYFHKRRLIIGGTFCGVYGLFCKEMTSC